MCPIDFCNAGARLPLRVFIAFNRRHHRQPCMKTICGVRTCVSIADLAIKTVALATTNSTLPEITIRWFAAGRGLGKMMV